MDGLEELKISMNKHCVLNVYNQRWLAKEDILADIASAKHDIFISARVYISEIMKDIPSFTQALSRATFNNTHKHLNLSYFSADPNYDLLVKEIWDIEDPSRREWSTIESYRAHLQRGDRIFQNTNRKLLDMRSHRSTLGKKNINMSRAYIQEKIIPYSIISIDRELYYVSYYDMSSWRYGTYSRTVKLLRCDSAETNVFTKLEDIRKRYEEAAVGLYELPQI